MTEIHISTLEMAKKGFLPNLSTTSTTIPVATISMNPIIADDNPGSISEPALMKIS